VSAARPAATIVVPTRDRPAGVQACVDALAACAAAAETAVDAIVVVDNNRSAPLEVATPAGCDVPLRVCREPAAGASRARNRGLAEATTDVVVFVDDDVAVSDGWLDALVEPLVDPQAVATVGPITLDFAPARPRWLTPDLESLFSALDLGSDTRPLGPVEHGWSANLAVRRSVACAIGGFDTRLGPGMPAAFGDDADFLDRLRVDGDTVVYAHRASVRHRVGPERLRLRWLAWRAYRQGVTEVALRHRDRSAPARRHPIRALRSLGGAVVRAFPRLLRTARDPVLRPGLFVGQVVLWSAKVGAAAGYWSPRVLGPMTADGRTELLGTADTGDQSP
jgi:GT2 family glycosyltransferase